jgi:hypothetical protein
MNSVKHSSRGGLVRGFQGSKGRWKGESYMMLAEEKEGDFLRREEAKFLVFFIIKMCGVGLEFHNN